MIHLISGDELIERTEAPEKMSLVQLRDYLCIGRSSSGVHNCSGLKQIIDLIPKPWSNDTPVNPAWSLLTKGDVQYQIKSLSELTESLLDKESIKERVLDNMSGSRAQKEADIENVKEILQVIVQEFHKTDLNKAMHGEVFEAFCQILESLIPDKQTNQQT
ncbi:uncharacterized protein LOC128179458 [Crassostrea angulata]|uniref:uncharacterized protein LOC128179458 n=1 Tax=Magallana angulata TaxID=2784310 RepID=UPI0022B0D3BB|nr:uncharacterized protein LOC128179458 [Crassostrea angulata]